MIEIKPLRHCDAVIPIPGSKSYTHRALIVSALAEGESLLIHALRSEDTEYTVEGLGKLGVPVFWEEGLIRVLGTGGKLKAGGAKIYVGNSGTSMRFLTALAGVRAYSQEGNGYPPIVVESEGLLGGVARIKGSESSQFVSALLLVAPYALGDVRIEVKGRLVSRPYVDITRDVMSAFGVEVQGEDYRSFFIHFYSSRM